MRFVSHKENTRLLKCVMFGELVGGAGCVEGQEKKWMGCLLDDHGAFGINVHQRTPTAQDEGEWRKTAEQGAERFMAKLVSVEKVRVGVRHAVLCPNVTGRTNERIAQNKRAHASSLAMVDKPQVARTSILRFLLLFTMLCCFSLVLLHLFGFPFVWFFVFLLSFK